MMLCIWWLTAGLGAGLLGAEAGGRHEAACGVAALVRACTASDSRDAVDRVTVMLACTLLDACGVPDAAHLWRDIASMTHGAGADMVAWLALRVMEKYNAVCVLMCCNRAGPAQRARHSGRDPRRAGLRRAGRGGGLGERGAGGPSTPIDVCRGVCMR